MKYINRLQTENRQLNNKINSIENQINDFVAFLHSNKFTSTESNGERKDWISTGDVILRLQEIRDNL